MPGSHDGSVSVLFSPQDISLATKFVDLSRYEQSYRLTPLTLWKGFDHWLPKSLPLVAGCSHRAEYDIILNYHISSNNGCPSIDRLPQIIAPPRPSRHLLFLFSPPCQVVVQRDSAKLIVKIQALKINLGTKFGTLKKPMFSFFDMIIFWFNGKINHKIFRARLLVSNIWYNRLPRIISPHFCAKKEIIAPGYQSRNYSNSRKRKRALLLVLFLTLWVKC